jgi:thymidine kinase
MLGKLDCITGPMFSGKSEELIRRLNKIKISGRQIRVFKPFIDIRTENFIKSRSGYILPAIALSDDQMMWDWETYPNKMVDLSIHTVAFDEAQFWHSGYLINFIDAIQERNINIIVSGLDTDYARQSFGAMPALLAKANTVTKLTAVCHNCGKDAPYSYRTTDDAVQILVGDTDFYEAACGDCHGR